MTDTEFESVEKIYEGGTQALFETSLSVADGELLVLVSGEVEVLRDGVRVAKAAEPGVVFGEMSALLGGPATATCAPKCAPSTSNT
jgi:CRP-like cAMP-binding protein